MEEFVIHLKNDVRELEKLTGELQKVAEEWNINTGIAMKLELILEEVFTNIVFHAFEDNAGHSIDVFLKRSGDVLRIRIEDDGKAFDLTRIPPADSLDKDIKERPVGGLGIHFIKEFSDHLTYERKNNKNILKITKGIR
ncbi:MAG: ATP-binding protein [Bacteroidales bacterium]